MRGSVFGFGILVAAVGILGLRYNVPVISQLGTPALIAMAGAGGIVALAGLAMGPAARTRAPSAGGALAGPSVLAGPPRKQGWFGPKYPCPVCGGKLVKKQVSGYWSFPAQYEWYCTQEKRLRPPY